MHSNTKPRYHPIDNPPYQINYRAKRSGKHITCTKRRVTFQFGFSNRDAIASGLTEGDCRGEEHEVVLIWSHVSGKRQIFMDGREIHMSKGPMGNTKFSHSWAIGNHVLKILANATPPTAEQARLNDGARQFDLFLDGMSYFKFCHIYQLGTGMPSSEVEQFGRNKLFSVASSSLSTSMNSDDLHDDDEENISPPPVSDLQIDVFEAPSTSRDLLELDLPSPYYSAFGQNGQPPSLTSTFSSSYDEFSPVSAPCVGNNKSFASISSEILTAYNGIESLKTLPPPQHHAAAQDPANGSLALVTTQVPTPYSIDGTPAEHQNFVSMYDHVDKEQDAVDDITRCMRKLVNLDDVTKPSPMFSKSSTGTKHQDRNQSLLSLQWALSGRAPTLSEIQHLKSTAKPSSIMMNNPQFLVASTSIAANQGAQQYGYHGAASGAYERAY